MALYRKYRPATFAEVVGQEHVTEPLSTALAAGRINHAYLFSGPRGCGKTSSARILARSLNCEQGPTPTPCGVCDSCVALGPAGAGSVDVIELDAASHGGVDDTRELRDRAFYAPAQSRYRIFIVDEAHMVTTAGFNALLKIVEEPPEHLIFVFATTEPEKVLPTIRSRTHHYPFRLLAPKTMRGLIERICTAEGVDVDEAVFPLVIRAGGGSPRDTLSVLDQLVAGSDGAHIAYPRALALLGATDVALIDDAVDALSAGDAAALFGAVEAVIDAGHDPRRFATDLLERFRDLLVRQAVPDAAARGVVDAPADVLERMREQANRVGTATLTRYAEVVHAGLGEMRGATAPRLLLEVVCARLLLPSASDSESALLQRVERIEKRLDMSVPEQPTFRRASAQPAPQPAPVVEKPAPAPVQARPVTPPPVAPPKPVPAMPPPRVESTRTSSKRAEPQPAEAAVAAPVSADAPPADAPGSLDAAAVRRQWSTVRAKVGERSKSLYAMLSDAVVVGLQGDTLVLSHPAATLVKRLCEQRNTEVIRESLKDALGADWKVRCELATATVEPVENTAASDEVTMLAEADGSSDEVVRRDPEEVALELLQSELGARRIGE